MKTAYLITLVIIFVSPAASAQSWVDPLMTPVYSGWTVAEVEDLLENGAKVPSAGCARACTVQDNVIDHSVLPAAVDLPQVNTSANLAGGGFVSSANLQGQLSAPDYATVATRLRLYLEAVHGSLAVNTQYGCLQTDEFAKEVAFVFGEYGQSEYADYADYDLVVADGNASVCYVEFDQLFPTVSFGAAFKINVKADAVSLYEDEVLDGCPSIANNVFASFFKGLYRTSWTRTLGTPRNTTFDCDVTCRDAAAPATVIDIDCDDPALVTWVPGGDHWGLASNFAATYDSTLTQEQCEQATTPSWMESDWDAVMSSGSNSIGKRLSPYISTPDAGACNEQGCGIKCFWAWRP